MEFDSLLAVSPIDGRYRNKVAGLSGYFSECALIKYRVQVEIEYFIALCNIPLPELESFDKNYFSGLRKIYEEFSIHDASRVKEIEQQTNHDVKAVEYFIKEYFEEMDISEYQEFIHFALTSQDINNTAVPLSMKEALNDVYYPLLDDLLSKLWEMAEEWKDITILARTHGQPASPTRIGKEISVFHERLVKQLTFLKSIPASAKFGGATGNFNAHHVAYPEVDWKKFADHFVNGELGLDRSQTTTQIEHYDNIGAMFDSMKRINTVLLDMAKDFWMYISMEYFKQQIVKNEVGSSTMPHKVNPIDFENAEGNLGVANALYEHLSSKLPISRLQRDLTDSTVLRNIGVPVAHTALSINSLIKGLNKLIVNKDAIDKDLEKNWSVISEAIQTILRKEGYPNPYETLKELTRNHAHINKETIHDFVDSLNISEESKKTLKGITPYNYTGI